MLLAIRQKGVRSIILLLQRMSRFDREVFVDKQQSDTEAKGCKLKTSIARTQIIHRLSNKTATLITCFVSFRSTKQTNLLDVDIDNKKQLSLVILLLIPGIVVLLVKKRERTRTNDNNNSRSSSSNGNYEDLDEDNLVRCSYSVGLRGSGYQRRISEGRWSILEPVLGGCRCKFLSWEISSIHSFNSCQLSTNLIFHFIPCPVSFSHVIMILLDSLSLQHHRPPHHHHHHPRHLPHCRPHCRPHLPKVR